MHISGMRMFATMLYTSVFQPFCCSGTLHKCKNHSRNPMTFNDPWVQWRRQSEIFRVSGDLKRWRQSSRQETCLNLPYYIILFNIFISLITKKHFTRQLPTTPKNIIGSFTFLRPRRSQNTLPQPVALIGKAFIFFKQHVSQNEGLWINGHTIP